MKHQMKIDYSQTIKTIRGKLCVSQAEFAEMLGVSFATVNRWENSRNNPSYKARRKMRSICKEHGVEPGEHL